MQKVEILSPVGNFEMLYQAIHNGADAIYLAGTKYGARKFADNFTEEELMKAIKYAKLFGVKVYITVNTLIYESELKSVLSYIEFLYQNGVDALIMQDIGVIQLVRKMYPNLEIHASTQCHNHDKYTVSLWKELGLTRVVLARELSLTEIKKIDVEIEKEVFVYGALCVAYSGCCLFSSLNGGRSGNRGECVGSCRLPYKLIRENQILPTEGDYLLSTRELNTLNHIKELMEAGIDSFKIEGRMKSPAYVGYVTRLYRTLIDKYYQNQEVQLTKEEERNLKKLFNREFTSGYLLESQDIMNIKSPNHLGIEIGKVIEATNKQIKIQLTDDSLSQNDGIRFKNLGKGMIVNRLYNHKKLLTNQIKQGDICFLDNKFGVSKGEIILKTIDYNLNQELTNYPKKKIPIHMEVECFLNTPCKLTLKDDNNTIIEFGDKVEFAQKREVTQEEITRQLSKLGDTPFILKDIKIEKDSNIFLNLKSINELRRKAISQLIEVRTACKKEFIKNKIDESPIILTKENNLNLNVLVRTESQLKCCLDNKIDNIYVTDKNLYQKYKTVNNIYYRTSRVIPETESFFHENLLVTELGSMMKYKGNNTIVSDYYLNVVNHHSVAFLKELGAKRITLSVELSDDNIKDIMQYQNQIELIILGRLELMVTKYCPFKECIVDCKNCQKDQKHFYLEGKNKERYPIIKENCLTHIMHSKNIDKTSHLKEYLQMGIKNFRIELWEETYQETEKYIQKIKAEISNTK